MSAGFEREARWNSIVAAMTGVAGLLQGAAERFL
jgi:hypothetical protein